MLLPAAGDQPIIHESPVVTRFFVCACAQPPPALTMSATLGPSAPALRPWDSMPTSAACCRRTIRRPRRSRPRRARPRKTAAWRQERRGSLLSESAREKRPGQVLGDKSATARHSALLPAQPLPARARAARQERAVTAAPCVCGWDVCERCGSGAHWCWLRWERKGPCVSRVKRGKVWMPQ